MILAATAKIRKNIRAKIGLKNNVSFMYHAQKIRNIYETGMALGVLRYAESNGIVYFIEKINAYDII